MRKTLLILALAAMAVAIAVPVGADSLYDQEGTAADGASGINAAGAGGAHPAACTTNWKHQYGSGSWSGIYEGSDAWTITAESGDMNLDVEADIELYMEETIENQKIYFHLGDPFNATTPDKTAYVNGTLKYNNGMYIGISFADAGGDPVKTEADFEKDGAGDFTGVILGGMQSDNDS